MGASSTEGAEDGLGLGCDYDREDQRLEDALDTLARKIDRPSRHERFLEYSGFTQSLFRAAIEPSCLLAHGTAIQQVPFCQ